MQLFNLKSKKNNEMTVNLTDKDFAVFFLLYTHLTEQGDANDSRHHNLFGELTKKEFFGLTYLSLCEVRRSADAMKSHTGCNSLDIDNLLARGFIGGIKDKKKVYWITQRGRTYLEGQINKFLINARQLEQAFNFQ